MAAFVEMNAVAFAVIIGAEEADIPRNEDIHDETVLISVVAATEDIETTTEDEDVILMEINGIIVDAVEDVALEHRMDVTPTRYRHRKSRANDAAGPAINWVTRRRTARRAGIIQILAVRAEIDGETASKSLRLNTTIKTTRISRIYSLSTLSTVWRLQISNRT